MKQIPALIAAFVITAIIGAGMFIVGGSALANKNTVTTYNSPSGAVAASNVSNVSASDPAASSQTQAQVAQLQDLINQYKARDQQYQAQITQAEQQLSQYNDQLTQANQEIQQFQSLLAELQSRGVIQITSNGQILIPRGFGDSR